MFIIFIPETSPLSQRLLFADANQLTNSVSIGAFIRKGKTGSHPGLTHGKDYSDVVLCDSRDVIFGDNPFPEKEHSLISGLENKRVSECDLNKRWVTEVFGESYLKPMLNKPIICAGVTYGKKARVVEYLEQTCQLMQKHLGRTAFRFGPDQASHNVIIRCGMNAHFHLSSNGEPYIATLGYSDLNNFDFDPKMGLLTKEGHPVKILHQYDRHPQLNNWALERYSSQTI